MLKLGVEEPIQRNDQIYTYDEKNNVMRLGEEFPETLNRYSFTADHIEELREVIPLISTGLSRMFDAPMKMVLGWDDRSFGYSSIKQKVFIKECISRAMTVGAAGGFGIAISQLKEVPDDLDCRDLISKKAYALWPSSSYEYETLSLNVDVLMQSLTRGLPAPDRRVVNLIEGGLNAVAYVNYDDAVRPGIIVITKKPIFPDIINYVDCAIQEMCEDSKARLVWGK